MAPKPITRNTLFYGDNLDILREHLPDESVDLIYLDPPFNSQANYNILFRDEKGAHWRLRGMATVQRVRHRGIGGRLLSSCIAHARDNGGGRLWCNGRSDARRFYERHGLRAVGEAFVTPC